MDAAWLGAEGEESVNPVFLGDVTAVFREEENALLCSQGLGEVSPRRMVGMRRGVEISCLAWAGRETAAISMPPLVCCPEPALALKMSPHLAQALAKLGKPQGPQHTCNVGRAGMGSCLTQPWEAARQPPLASLTTVCDRALQGAGAAGWHLWASNAGGLLRAACSEHQMAGLCIPLPKCESALLGVLRATGHLRAV